VTTDYKERDTLVRWISCLISPILFTPSCSTFLCKNRRHPPPHRDLLAFVLVGAGPTGVDLDLCNRPARLSPYQESWRERG